MIFGTLQNDLENTHGAASRPRPNALGLSRRISALLSSTQIADDSINDIAKLLTEDLALWCAIDLLTTEGQVERIAAAHRYPEKDGLIAVLLQKFPARPIADRGVYKVLETREAILVPFLEREAVARHTENAEHLDLIMSLGSKSYMCVPLLTRNRIVGTLTLFADERTYDLADVAVAQDLGRLIAIAIDHIAVIEKLQRTVDELKSTQEQLLMASKLSALSLLSAGLTHEINNPLAVIRVYAEKLQTDFTNGIRPSDDQMLKIFGKIILNVDRIAKITADVRDFARTKRETIENVDLNEILRSATELFQTQTDARDIAIDLVGRDDALVVRGDGNRLLQVFVNILLNGKDAILARAPAKPRLLIHRAVTSEHVQISIADNGIGINCEDAKHVFEPFFTTKDIGRGTGLGLAVSHGIVNAHGGEISFKSFLGKGSVVTISLPKVDPAGLH